MRTIHITRALRTIRSLVFLTLALLAVVSGGVLAVSPAMAQTAIPTPPPLPPDGAPLSISPSRPVADSVVEQAGEHAEGRFTDMVRAGVGGQVQEAWDETDNEAGVFDFVLCDTCTYKVRLREHMVTVLELPEGEVIERADVGDGGSFDVRARGHRRLAIKPLGFGVDSNLMVYGMSGVVYPVYLRAESFNSRNVPDLFVRITGTVVMADPAVAGIEGVPTVGVNTVRASDGTSGTSDFASDFTSGSGPASGPEPLVVEDAVAAIVAGGVPATPGADDGDFVRDVPFDPDALRGWGDYSLWSGGPDGALLRPETVFRDDHFTYIRFGGRLVDLELPVAYVVVDGIDELVNTRLMGTTLVVESTRSLITLKNGLSWLCIRYGGGSTHERQSSRSQSSRSQLYRSQLYRSQGEDRYDRGDR